ncbi:MAG: L,D-transpeptidase family protein [Hyphomicrobiaceae bacterium]|nr:L,D-transpeptidase family protein [Hyphomicrobiaceae bacterium]
MLQVSIIVLALGLLFGGNSPADAQGYGAGGRGFNTAESYYIKSSLQGRRAKTVRKQIRNNPNNFANARGINRIGKARRKARRRARRLRKRRFKKRKTVSRVRKKIARKKIARKTKSNLNISAKEPVQIVVSLPRQRVSIYKGGKIIASSRVSSGKLGHRTPPGIFSIIQKNKRHFSNLYGGAPMPFMQRITWSGIALHAGNVSRPYASHGCIRLPYGFAKTLFKRTSMGAHVIVASTSASPQSIVHDNLFQPLHEGVVVASNGPTGSVMTDQSSVGDARPELELGGLPGFVKPVVQARQKLMQKEKDLEKSIAAVPALAQAREQLEKELEARKASLNVAKKVAFASGKSLREPRAVVSKIKRKRSPKTRALRKAESRAKWAWKIVDKRRDNPRFEGNWMKKALARARSRDEIVAVKQAAVDDITKELDVATAQYDELLYVDRNARATVKARQSEIYKTQAALKKAQKDLLSGKQAVLNGKRAIRKAKSAIKSAMAREKMPLRILVTPRRGRERTIDTQKILAELGYEVGVADGAVGSMTRTAIKAFQRELGLKESGRISDSLVEELYKRVGRTQEANAHMYVRQGFVDLFDAPVGISDATKPIGTHVYTAMYFDKDKGDVPARWTALTVRDSGVRQVKTRRVRGKKRRKAARKTIRVPVVRVSAKEALNRIVIPGVVKRQISTLLTPGSSLVISDKGMSHETGKGTDFVILTK